MSNDAAVEICRGFWNMCGCEACRKADIELDKKLSTGTLEQRKQALEAAIAERLSHESKDNA